MNIITESLTSELVRDQKEVYSCNICGINLVNLDKFYQDAFYITNHTAYEYNIEFNFKNKDIKKIFYNAFIFTLCEFLKENKQKNVFYFKENNNKHYTFIVNKCKVLLPIYIFTNSKSYTEIISFINKGDADICSKIEIIISDMSRFNFFDFTFKRLNSFLNKNELLFLKNAYFTQHQIKLALLT
jgi:hypothetical protein